MGCEEESLLAAAAAAAAANPCFTYFAVSCRLILLRNDKCGWLFLLIHLFRSSAFFFLVFRIKICIYNFSATYGRVLPPPTSESERIVLTIDRFVRLYSCSVLYVSERSIYVNRSYSISYI